MGRFSIYKSAEPPAISPPHTTKTGFVPRSHKGRGVGREFGRERQPGRKADLDELDGFFRDPAPPRQLPMGSWLLSIHGTTYPPLRHTHTHTRAHTHTHTHTHTQTHAQINTNHVWAVAPRACLSLSLSLSLWNCFLLIPLTDFLTTHGRLSGGTSDCPRLLVKSG